MTEKVLIEFVKPWGHPTKNEIYGPPQRVWATAWQADQLVAGNYAKKIEEDSGERTKQSD